jgi:hypothetical protein
MYEYDNRTGGTRFKKIDIHARGVGQLSSRCLDLFLGSLASSHAI